MQHNNFKKLSRQILITVISCSFLGLFTGTVGIVAWRGEFKIEWILILLCWISAIMFSGFIHLIISRSRKTQKRIPSPTAVTLSRGITEGANEVGGTGGTEEVEAEEEREDILQIKGSEGTNGSGGTNEIGGTEETTKSL
jgi:hypothetical protein